MKPKTIILMSIAILCGLGASYMTTRLLNERQPSEQEKVKIFVAKKSLNMGDPVKNPEDMFEEKEFVKDTEPRNAIVSLDKASWEKLKDKMMKRSLRAGDFLTDEDMLGKDDKNAGSMQVMLPPGFRAIGIRVSLEDIAAGFAAMPMSRVDIISTVRRGDDKSTYSQMLLEDVLVVAADTQMSRNETGTAMPASVVTVAVKPEDALRISLAKQMGQLSLVLRKLNDASKAADDILTWQDVKQKKSEDATETESGAPPKAAVPPAPGSGSETVTVRHDPTGKRHVLMIYEGDNPAKRVDYLLDKEGVVVNVGEIMKTDLTPPLPAAAPAALPPPTAVPPAVNSPLAPPAPNGLPPAPNPLSPIINR